MRSDTKAALRGRVRRIKHGGYPRRAWTIEDRLSLLLLLDALGRKWLFIARIMGRSPDSLRGQLARMREEEEIACAP